MRGRPEAAEASMTLQQPEGHWVFSPGSCPWITGHWQWQPAQAPGRGGVVSDLYLLTGFLVAAAAAYSFHALLSPIISGVRADRCSSRPFLELV